MIGKKTVSPEKEITINLDTTPILYTDNVLMTINSSGLVLDIGQKLGTSNQVRIVARVGMSREHARKLVQKMGELIIVAEGKEQTSDKKLN